MEKEGKVEKSTFVVEAKVKVESLVVVGNEEEGKESKFLRTKKEEIKADINDNAKVC